MEQKRGSVGKVFFFEAYSDAEAMKPNVESRLSANDPFADIAIQCEFIPVRITDLQPGDVYRLKNDAELTLFAQVCEGGDVGFFAADSAAGVSEQHPQFRVLMNQPDFKRHWKKIGNLPINEALSGYAWYGDADIGCETRYKVRLDDLDNRIEIDAATYENLERLAVWETPHVLERFESA